MQKIVFGDDAVPVPHEEGQEIEAKILSIDPEAQRISLSIKAIAGRPEDAVTSADETDATPAEPLPPPKHKTLKGGTTTRSEGEKFGLKW